MNEGRQTQSSSEQLPESQPVIQDIFAAADEQQQPLHELQYQPLPNIPHTPTKVTEVPHYSARPRWVLPALIAVVVLVLAVTATVIFMVSRSEDSNNLNQVSVVNVNTSQPINEVHIPSANTNAPEVVVDTDGDGLTDIEESEYKTDIRLIDSDQDGLTDREEIKVYATNPLKSDTDGDRYLDGEEVRKLFNPKGPGRLFNIKEEIDKAQSQTNQ
ncbi:MAG: hypothetical protein KIH62_001595 [Candidatus Kerfeldbacteria bacterium]|nr:hypothetical protein [Candidatus Kerfeldbacteria bacterium]